MISCACEDGEIFFLVSGIKVKMQNAISKQDKFDFNKLSCAIVYSGICSQPSTNVKDRNLAQKIGAPPLPPICPHCEVST